MVRVVFVLALLGVMIPSGVYAQTYVVPSCVDPAVMSRSSYAPPIPCVVVPPVPAPPVVGTHPDVPAWLQPRPAVPPPAFLTVVPPPYVPPVSIAPVPSGGGIDPWIPLALRPAPVQSPLDVMTQILLLQELTAARPRPQPAPVVQPVESAVPEFGWMHAFIKPVKK